MKTTPYKIGIQCCMMLQHITRCVMDSTMVCTAMYAPEDFINISN